MRLVVLSVAAYAVALAAMHWADGRARRLRDEKRGQLRAANVPTTVEELVGTTPLPDGENASVALSLAHRTLVASPIALLESQVELCAPGEQRPIGVFDGGDEFHRLAHAAARLKRTDEFARVTSGRVTALGAGRGVAKALVCYAAAAAARRDLDAALDEIDAIAGIRDSAWHAPSSVIQFLVGSATATLRCRTLRDDVAPPLLDCTVNVDRERVQALIHGLMDDDPVRRAWHDAIIGERVYILSDPFGSFGARGPSSPLLPPNLVALSYNAAAPALVDFFAAYEEAADNALLEPVHAPPLIRARAGAADRAAHFTLDLVTPVLRHEVLFAEIMTERLTACVLATALYIRDYGEPPVSLFDLVPEYLPGLPTDSFDKGDGYVQMRIVGLRVEFSTVDPDNVNLSRKSNGGEPEHLRATLEFGERPHE